MSPKTRGRSKAPAHSTAEEDITTGLNAETFKGLAWRSVEIPMVMPKPELMPLTGGYRKTPVLQIGAEVYCDTSLILAEIERGKEEAALVMGGLPVDLDGRARLAGEHRLGADDVRDVVLHRPSR